jgi:hypothetical protein
MNKTAPFETVEELMPWLERRGAEELRDWLREAIEENSRLRQKLARQAQRELGQELDLTVLKRQVVQATAPPPDGYVNWRGVSAYCDAMETTCVDPLEEMLEDGHAAEVVELAEWVLSLTERTSEHVQDAGEVGMVGDRLRALHLEACRRAKPDGVALAGRLFAQVIASPWDPFPDVVETYQEFFGAEGLAEFRSQAEARLAGLPVPPPEPPEICGDIPVKQAKAAYHQREQQMRNIRELQYPRETVSLLLKKCQEAEATRAGPAEKNAPMGESGLKL